VGEGVGAVKSGTGPEGAARLAEGASIDVDALDDGGGVSEIEAVARRYPPGDGDEEATVAARGVDDADSNRGGPCGEEWFEGFVEDVFDEGRRGVPGAQSVSIRPV
jgi:hypothetical protein